MIVRGKSRGWGGQLGNYLEAQGENESITPLEVRGTAAQDVRRAVREMSLRTELTKRGKLGLYHAQIAPAYGEDGFTAEQWKEAADQLEKALGLTGQPRVIVLHEKKGKVHAHLVWQREKEGKLIKMSHSYRAHDRVRAALERQHRHERTRQPHDHKAELTRLWESTRDAAQFKREAEAAGYRLARGDRRPFHVVTPDGEKLDLVRQLQGIRTAQARERLDVIAPTLPHESEVQGSPKPTRREQYAEGRKRRAEKEKPERRQRRQVRPEPEKVRPQEAANDNQPAQESDRQRRGREAAEAFGDVVRPEQEKGSPTAADQIRAAQERTKAKEREARENAKPTTEKAKEAGQTLDDITSEDAIRAAQRRARERGKDRDRGRNLERD